MSSAMYPDLKSKTAFVSGGASGVGAAVVRALHEQGCKVAFVDIDDASARCLCAELEGPRTPAPFFQRCDLRDLDALDLATRAVLARFGAIDILVNNAGCDALDEGLGQAAPACSDKGVAADLRHYFFATQAVLPHMRAKGAGAIINFSVPSWRGKAANNSLFSATRAACHGLTRGLARDIGQAGIRINTVTPGWVLTEKHLSGQWSAGPQREIAQQQCLKSSLLPGDLAEMVLFLASDASRMCTAQEFVVDGGWT